MTLGEDLRWRGGGEHFQLGLHIPLHLYGKNSHLLHTESIVLAMKMIQLARPSTYPFLERMPVRSLQS